MIAAFQDLPNYEKSFAKAEKRKDDEFSPEEGVEDIFWLVQDNPWEVLHDPIVRMVPLNFICKLIRLVDFAANYYKKIM